MTIALQFLHESKTSDWMKLLGAPADLKNCGASFSRTVRRGIQTFVRIHTAPYFDCHMAWGQ
jgi:hypothetical protein